MIFKGAGVSFDFGLIGLHEFGTIEKEAFLGVKIVFANMRVGWFRCFFVWIFFNGNCFCFKLFLCPKFQNIYVIFFYVT